MTNGWGCWSWRCGMEHRILSRGLFVIVAAIAMAAGGVLACSSDECSGPACHAATGGMGQGGDSNQGTAGVAGAVEECRPWRDPNRCVAEDTCPDDVSLDIEALMSLPTASDATPEIVDLVRGSANRMVVISSSANAITEVIYSETTLEVGRQSTLDTESDTSNMASIK